MEESPFIWILEHGERVGLDGTSLEAATKSAQADGVLPATGTPEFTTKFTWFRRLFQEAFDCPGVTLQGVLKSEYFFRLIEFRELQESREAALSARRWAAAALVVSIVAIAASTISAHRQMTTPLKIEGPVEFVPPGATAGPPPAGKR